MTTRGSVQRGFESIVGLIQVEVHLAGLLGTQLFSSTHLIERYKPLDNLALAFEVPVGDFVDGLNRVDEDRVERVLGQNVHSHRIEQRDEVFGGRYDCCRIRGAGSIVWGLGIGSAMLRSSTGRYCLDGCR